MNLINDFFSLMFPDLCVTCSNSLFRHEKIICTRCDFHLPRTGFHNDIPNPVMEIFTGRTEPAFATSYFYYNKGSHVQKLIHLLKYKGRRDIGFWLGQMAGSELITSPCIKDPHVIIPVPLHPLKEKKRGYNQSTEFAKGLAGRMNIPVDDSSLIRVKASATQTRKSRFSRWENVSGIFSVREKGAIEGRHCLLVDDVITTGSTVEACIIALMEAGAAKVTVASIAAAVR